MLHGAATRVLLADVDGRPRRALAGLIRGLDTVALVGEIGERADVAAALRGASARRRGSPRSAPATSCPRCSRPDR
jgi:hypothetical protein